MESELLSCKASLQHGDKWLLQTVNDAAETPPCFACFMLSLEDAEQLSLRKRAILSYLRDILESNYQILINVAITDNEVVFHTIQVFSSLINCNDERLTKLAGECLLLFLIHMKKEWVGLAVAQRLTVEIEEYCNYTRCLPHFHVLGRLFEIFPGLVVQTKCERSKFLHVLAGGLLFPSDSVKSAILFLLRHIYQNSEKSKSSSIITDAAFVKNLLRILKGSQNKHLLKNALGLLEIFISKVPQSLSTFFEITSDDVSFTDVVKKIILSHEPAFQVCIVQCLCQMFTKTLVEKQISLLLEANIPEILLEALSTKNELLLESILCCLQLFIHRSADTLKSRFVFGVGIIADVAYSLLDLRNWRLLCLALNLLTLIISSNQYLVTSTQVTFFLQAMQLSEKTFKVHNPTLLFAVCKFFTEFLKNKNLPWPFPIQQICDNVNLCLKAQSRFVSTLTLSEQMKKHLGTTDSLPIELKLLTCNLDMIYSCIRICKEYNLNPVSVENGFVQPNIQKLNDSSLKSEKQISQPLVSLCLSSIDEIFIPCCLQLKSSNFGRISWYHLVRVLSAVFEDVQDDILLFHLAKKLIKSGFFKYLFELKIDKIPLNECNADQVKSVCNQCIKGLLKCFLKHQNYSEIYLKSLENGVINLNDSLEDCASVLSQRVDLHKLESDETCTLSSQRTFLCICYISYLNEAIVVNIKTLVPHLIYFVTCNADMLSSCTIVLKHLIFLMSVCTYDYVSRNSKFLTGLTEANILCWDLLSKSNSPHQVYTHHKYLLWWCFKNETCNAFSSTVLFTWLTYCIDDKHSLRHCAMKTVIHLLCSNSIARQTFVLLFGSSSSNNEALILFLENASKLEILSVTNIKKNFLDLIVLMIKHLHVWLVKLFIMKNENDKRLNHRILCQGLKCFLWCHEQIENFEVDSKIIFHVSKYCFSVDIEKVDSLIACLKFLQFMVKHNNHFEKAWYVITGDLNFSSFFYKSFSFCSQLEVDALCLLVSLFCCQVNCNLKCIKCVQLSPNQILKWLNSSMTQVLAYQLLNCLIKCEFDEDLLIFIPFRYDQTSFKNVQYVHYRLFSLYFQNAIISENPIFKEETIKSYLKLFNIISKIDKALENHIMLQPWIKMLLESRLEMLDSSTWELFEKWLNFNELNISLIGVMQQFSNRVQNVEPVTEVQRNCMEKLCTGVYASYMPKEVREALGKLSTSRCEVREERNLVSQVETLVSSFMSSVP